MALDSNMEELVRVGAYAKGADAGRTNKEKNAWLAKHQSFAADLIKFNGSDFKSTKAAEARAGLATLKILLLSPNYTKKKSETTWGIKYS